MRVLLIEDDIPFGNGLVAALKAAGMPVDWRRDGLAAQATALHAQPGIVADQELEKDSGVSGLRYSSDIKDSAGTHEVGIDAATGALLENSAEVPHAD